MRKITFALFSVFMLLLSVVSVNALFARITGAASHGGPDPYISSAGQLTGLPESYVTVDNPDSIDREIEVTVTFWRAGSKFVGSDSDTQVIPANSFHTYSFVIPAGGADEFDTRIYDTSSPSTPVLLSSELNIPLSGSTASSSADPYIKDAFYDPGQKAAQVEIDNPDVVNRIVSVIVYFYDQNSGSVVQSVSKAFTVFAQSSDVEPFSEPTKAWDYFDVELYDGAGSGAQYIGYSGSVWKTGGPGPLPQGLDLAVLPSSVVSPTPGEQVQQGSSLDVSFWIDNVGTVDAKNVEWGLIIEDSTRNTVDQVSDTLGKLAAGDFTSVGYSYDTSLLKPGVYVLKVGVDPYGNQNDIDRSNDYQEVKFEVLQSAAKVDTAVELISLPKSVDLGKDLEIEMKFANRGTQSVNVDYGYLIYDAAVNVYHSESQTATLSAGSSTPKKVKFNTLSPNQLVLTAGKDYYVLLFVTESTGAPEVNDDDNVKFGKFLQQMAGSLSPSQEDTRLVFALKQAARGTAISPTVTPTNTTSSVPSVGLVQPPRAPRTPTTPGGTIAPPPRPIARASTSFDFNFEGGKFYLMNKEFFEGISTGSVKLNPASMSCLANNLAGWTAQYYDSSSGDWVFTPTNNDVAAFIYVEPGYDCVLSGTLDPKAFTSGWSTQSIPGGEYAPAGISYDWLDSNGLTLGQTVEDCSTMAAPKDVWVWDETALGGQGDWESFLNRNIDPTGKEAAAVALGVVLYC